MIHNRHRPTYHLQPAVPAVHTLIQYCHRVALTECLTDPIGRWHTRWVGGTFSDTVPVACLHCTFALNILLCVLHEHTY